MGVSTCGIRIIDSMEDQYSSLDVHLRPESTRESGERCGLSREAGRCKFEEG